jgi:serine-type D-Ala-D-Ala carboxypeptidase
MTDSAFRDVAVFLTEHQQDGFYPGAAVSIGLKKTSGFQSLLKSGFGNLEPVPGARAVIPDTIFDLASLTKPIATAFGLLLLKQNGMVDLDRPGSFYLEELRNTDKADIRLIQLLTHTSGLPAWKPLYVNGRGIDRVLKTLVDTPLETLPGTAVSYSCLGYILLGEIIRRIANTTLTKFAQDWIFKPMGMNNTFFNPRDNLNPGIAPTELGNEFERSKAGFESHEFSGWRQYRLRGEVQDGNSHALDGEGGNAGLFSTVNDLSCFAEMMLSSGRSGDRQIIDPELIKYSISNHTSELNSGRGIGWQMAVSSLAVGSSFSLNGYGHNGFTGTSIWIDPDRQVYIILLTNRTYYGGDGTKFGQIRRPFHDLVLKCLDRF